MNTKQKLTIGIAAIFMVTLTIVGVTYAYFVTQVNTGEQAGVNVQTATFGNVTFVKDQESVTLNSMAADDSETMNFSVTNDGDSSLSYDLVLRHSDGAKSFLKSAAKTDTFDPATACYNLADDALATPDENCYKGTNYDNVSVVITRYTSEDARTNKTGGEEVYSGKLMVDSPYDIQENISIGVGEAATHYYTLTVTHDDAGVNQNLETEASVTVIPDIASVG